jgi:glycerol-3-phosphate cytidylyltransferase-like family protein
VDTRTKILTIEGAARIPDRPLVLVTGTFDIVCAGHIRQLNELPPGKVFVAVLPTAVDFLPHSARCEVVAALRMVDYVVAADPDAVDHLIQALQPAAVVRLEAADALRARHLIEHVRRVHNR